MVDMQVLPGIADLASPAIAPQYVFSQLVITVRDQVASAAAWVECASRSFLGHFVRKSLLLFAREKFEEP
jgi:hypothetical protein